MYQNLSIHTKFWIKKNIFKCGTLSKFILQLIKFDRVIISLLKKMKTDAALPGRGDRS